MTPRQARAMVEARLGRPAQDELEAAVVLEAWAGLEAGKALEIGRKVVRRRHGQPAREEQVDCSDPLALPPGGWGRALGAAAIGAGLGALLVSDPTIGWGLHGAILTLALLPSTVGGVLGARHLSRIYMELPRALRGVPFSSAERIATGSPALLIAGGAVLRLMAATAVLSAGCVVAGTWTSGTISTSLFVGFGFLALATLLVSLLASIGRPVWALLAVGTGVAIETALELPQALALPGSGLIAGAAVVVLMVLPPLVKTFLRPGRALATAIWIS